MYRHSQVGLLILLLAGAVAVVVPALLVSRASTVGIAVGLFLVALAALFYRLVVEVDAHAIRLAFGIGLVRRSIPVGDVVSAEPVRNRWWYGWGIRLTPRGWMWNVSGLDAVELTYRDGNHFRIGTDEPDELARAIRRAAGLPEGGA